jgi:hypothetical protein
MKIEPFPFEDANFPSGPIGEGGETMATSHQELQ